MANLTDESVSVITCGYQAPAQLFSSSIVPFTDHPTPSLRGITFADYFDGKYWVAAPGPKIAWSTDLINWTVVQDDGSTNFNAQQATAVGYLDGAVTAFPAEGVNGDYTDRIYNAAVTIGSDTYTNQEAHYTSGVFDRYFIKRSENVGATGQTELLMQSDSTTSAWGATRFDKSHGTADGSTILASRHETFRGGSGEFDGGFFASDDGGISWSSVIGNNNNTTDGEIGRMTCLTDGVGVLFYDYSVDYDTRLLKFTKSGSWTSAVLGTYPVELDWVRDIAYYDGKHFVTDSGTNEGLYWANSISSDIGDWTEITVPVGTWDFTFYLANRNGKLITAGAANYAVDVLDMGEL